MSDFLSVAPQGWIELTILFPYANANAVEVQHTVQEEGWADLEVLLINTEQQPPAGKHITMARLVFQEDGIHIWALIE